MEMEASDRDQTMYACSAQNSKMLPKKRKKNAPSSTAAKLKASAAPYFEGI